MLGLEDSVARSEYQPVTEAETHIGSALDHVGLRGKSRAKALGAAVLKMSRRIGEFMKRIALVVALIAVNPASAQITGTANLGGSQPMVSTPIPDGDFAAVAKKLGLVESAKPARELIKGGQKPRKILVSVDNNTNRLAWLQAAAPGVTLVAVHTLAEKNAQIADADALLRMPC